MVKYGLVGKHIDYSFSKTFFTEKFEREKLKATYENFDLDSIEELQKVLKIKGLRGLNVTIPYKEAIIPYLDSLDEEAEMIGAVNTIKIKKNGNLKGYNTDHFGFAKALEGFFPFTEKTALVLGSGGASKAVRHVLDAMAFDYKLVSREKTTHNDNTLTYHELGREIMEHYLLIVNCTPLGTYPNISKYPPIPYQFITKKHILFDLTYNPPLTEFLKMGFASGARISNGQKMLEQQALKSWSIWKS
ncbi:MAG TPA: shikimate dehydrogenase [Flavobacteriaceae bacterium]|nr:shikimate dehydrogenase [Flavobacteriaceae bacterium]MCB9212409.1 shikimate dehydrogenase [Alteromonas sp.]HPF11685.1 shikimate dehydrogenase [Flavobacteriaceae bacterium]HQU20160.1 shikimate dehydrogenase [Flavobacteriaceae bacterium]HQU64751.1 shikimate dehydrogenase [Flavobacteriaceae bacterium]